MPQTQTLQLDGKRFIVIEEAEYERLTREAGEAIPDDDLPALPQPDKNGRFPALEYARISLARSLIRDRKAAGLSQQRLADLAGIRQETISRLEAGKHTASVTTIERLDNAIAKARKAKHRKGR